MIAHPEFDFAARTEDQTSGLPAGTVAHVQAIAEALIRSGSPFTTSPTREGHRNVYESLAPLEREIVDAHPAILGSLGGRWSARGYPRRVGRAKHRDARQRRYVTVWQGDAPPRSAA